MLWIGVAIAAAFVLLLIVRAMGDAGKEATAPAGGEAALRQGNEGVRASIPPRDKREDEPEGSKVASVPPPGSAANEKVAVAADVPVDMALEEDQTGPIALILVTAVGRTDPGRRRKHNEDAYLVMEKEAVFAIADGMGGYAAGEVASQLAVDVINESFKTNTFTGEADPALPRRGDELIRAIQMSNTAILTQARANEAQSGMGTTIVSCRFSPNKQRVYICDVRDSRPKGRCSGTWATAAVTASATARSSRSRPTTRSAPSASPAPPRRSSRARSAFRTPSKSTSASTRPDMATTTSSARTASRRWSPRR